MLPIAEVLTNLGFQIDLNVEYDPKAYEELKAEHFNSTEGKNTDGYDCPECKNRGAFMRVVENGGSYTTVIRPCKCKKIRDSLRRLRVSGLEIVARDYTFKAYEITEDWQKDMKHTAAEYVKAISSGDKPNTWLFMGGNNGSGKTHLCTAAAVKLLSEGFSTRYMLWKDDGAKIKAAITDADEYERLIYPLKTCDLLYIDDLFKVKTHGEFKPDSINPGDINLAFEILNYRYQAKKPTIISTERYIDEIIDIDQAIGGRIAERAFKTGFAIEIKRDKSRDYRMKGLTI